MTSRYVVMVGRREEHSGLLSSALAADGWEVRRCDGPAGSRCPLLSGGDCELRDSAAAAIVYLDPRRRPSGSVPLVRCAAASSAPAVVVLEGRVDAPRRDAGFAVVGGLRPPAVIAETLGALLANPPVALVRGKEE